MDPCGRVGSVDVGLLSHLHPLYGFPGTGLVWVSLAFSGALWLRMRSTRLIAQVLNDLDTEPVRVAVDAPGPVALMVPKAVPGWKGDRLR